MKTMTYFTISFAMSLTAIVSCNSLAPDEISVLGPEIEARDVIAFDDAPADFPAPDMKPSRRPSSQDGVIERFEMEVEALPPVHAD